MYSETSGSAQVSSLKNDEHPEEVAWTEAPFGIDSHFVQLDPATLVFAKSRY